MNAYGYWPRDWAYLMALELSEVIGHHVLPTVTPARREAAERFAEEEWRFVAQLQQLCVARGTSRLPKLRRDVAALRAQAVALELSEFAATFVYRKLDEIAEALDEVAAE